MYFGKRTQLVVRFHCACSVRCLQQLHYAVDTMVNKAYKKLALKLHPDKNKAPGADEVYRALDMSSIVAVACLRLQLADHEEAQSELTLVHVAVWGESIHMSWIYFNHTRISATAFVSCRTILVSSTYYVLFEPNRGSRSYQGATPCN